MTEAAPINGENRVAEMPPDSPFQVSGNARRYYRGAVLLLFGIELLLTGQALIEFSYEYLIPSKPDSTTGENDTPRAD